MSIVPVVPVALFVESFVWPEVRSRMRSRIGSEVDLGVGYRLGSQVDSRECLWVGSRVVSGGTTGEIAWDWKWEHEWHWDQDKGSIMGSQIWSHEESQVGYGIMSGIWDHGWDLRLWVVSHLGKSAVSGKELGVWSRVGSHMTRTSLYQQKWHLGKKIQFASITLESDFSL